MKISKIQHYYIVNNPKFPKKHSRNQIEFQKIVQSKFRNEGIFVIYY